MSEMDGRLDEEIRQMRQNIAELRKRRELVDLQAEFEVENRRLDEAQRKLEAARGPTKSRCEDTQAHASQQQQQQNTVTQTPSKQSRVANGGSPTAVFSPPTNSDGFIIKGSAQTNAVDSFMASLGGDMELGQAPAKAPAPAQTDASQTNGRPNSQLADSLTDQPHSQDLQRPNGAPVSRQRVAEEPSLTVIRPGHPAPTTESGSNSGNENEESDAMEESSGGDSRSDGGHALPRRPPPHTPTGPANSRTGFAPRNDLRTSPSEPRKKIYRASSLRECKDLIADLETQFSDKPQSYKLNIHKIQLGETYLSDSQLERWKLQRREFIEPSWTSFRLFLAELIADIVPAEVARSKYTDSSQGKGETVLNYALYLQTFAPHFNSAHHNRLRHLWDRINPELKSMAGRNWEGFQTYHQFLDFLIKIEDSLPSRSRPGDFRPRKRRRSNS